METTVITDTTRPGLTPDQIRGLPPGTLLKGTYPSTGAWVILLLDHDKNGMVIHAHNSADHCGEGLWVGLGEGPGRIERFEGEILWKQ